MHPLNKGGLHLEEERKHWGPIHNILCVLRILTPWYALSGSLEDY